MAPPPKFVPLRARNDLGSRPALSTKPRKVRMGLKLPPGEIAGTGEAAWGAQRWLRVLEAAGEPAGLIEGLEYARLGQTKRLTVMTGKVESVVQGRAVRPYACAIAFEPFSPEQWEKVVGAMSANAMHAAKLLAGELPSTIEEVFAPLGLKLFPLVGTDVRVACECGHAMARRADGTGGWCKHVLCAGYLLASRLASEHFLMFQIRGIEAADLLDRLRQRRAIAGSVTGSATPVYQQRVAGVSDRSSAPLDASLHQFWSMPARSRESLEALDLSLRGPEVTHPLLRRLGASPWTGPGSFPLVGLLASCYETISDDVQRSESDERPLDSNGSESALD